MPDDCADYDTVEQSYVRMEHWTYNPGESFEPQFSLEELEWATLRLSRRGAPGICRIPSEIVRRISETHPDFLLGLYNKCLWSGVFPLIWKQALLNILLKTPDKPRDEIKSYRLICLLSSLGKVLERLMVGRLMRRWGECGGQSSLQFGFTEGRSTEDDVNVVINYVRGSTTKYMAVVLVDIGGAFDNLWWPSIFRRLRELHLPGNLYALFTSYFADRSVLVRTDGGHLTKLITKGCPQGSVIGPVLWNLVFDEIVQPLEGDCGSPMPMIWQFWCSVIAVGSLNAV